MERRRGAARRPRSAGRLHSIVNYDRILYTLKDLCGQGMVSRWPEKIWDHPSSVQSLESYLPGHGVTAREKNRFFNFVWDMTASGNAARIGLFKRQRDAAVVHRRACVLARRALADRLVHPGVRRYPGRERRDGAVSAVEGQISPEPTRIMPAGHWDWSIPVAAFSQGWCCGPFVFVGGQISADDQAAPSAPATSRHRPATCSRTSASPARGSARRCGTSSSSTRSTSSRARATRGPRVLGDDDPRPPGVPRGAGTGGHRGRCAGLAYPDLLIEDQGDRLRPELANP